jgi:hypothetical protein
LGDKWDSYAEDQPTQQPAPQGDKWAQYAEGAGGGDNKPNQPGFWSNFGHQLNPVAAAEGIYKTVRHPIDTGTRVASAADPYWKQAMAGSRAGDVWKYIRNLPGATVPMAGPPISDALNEWSQGKVGPGSGTLAGSAVAALIPGLARVAGPKVAGLLEEGAATNYRRALQPSEADVTTAERTAEGLAQEKPIARSIENLRDQARAQKDVWGPQAAAAYNGKTVSSPGVDEILDHVDKMWEKNVAVKGSNMTINPELDAYLQKLSDDIAGMRDKSGSASAIALDDLADKLNGGMVTPAGRFRESVSPQTAASIEQGLARSIKRVLDREIPDAAAVNAKYRTWASTDRLAEKARQSSVAADSRVSRGSAVGGKVAERFIPAPIRRPAEAATGFFDSVPWNTLSGATKAAVAEAVLSGNYKRATQLLGAAAPTQVMGGLLD